VPFNSAVVIDSLRAKVVAQQVIKEQETTSSSPNLDECFLRTPQEPKSIKKVINHVLDFYRKENTFDVHSNLLFRLFKRTKEQANTLKLVTQDLNECLTATATRKERRLQRDTIVANNVIEPMTTRDCKHMVSTRAQRIEKLVVAKAKQETQRVARKAIANALKIVKRIAMKTTRDAKRSKKRAKMKTKKEIYVARKAVVAAKRQEREAKKAANVAKRAKQATTKRVIVVETITIKNTKANETYNQELQDAMYAAQKQEQELSQDVKDNHSNLYPKLFIPQYISSYATTTSFRGVNATLTTTVKKEVRMRHEHFDF